MNAILRYIRSFRKCAQSLSSSYYTCFCRVSGLKPRNKYPGSQVALSQPGGLRLRSGGKSEFSSLKTTYDPESPIWPNQGTYL